MAKPPHSRSAAGSQRAWRRARWARRGVQIAAFILFLLLAVTTQQAVSAAPTASLFFRLDPLAALSAMVAAREWLPHFVPALVVLALTIVLGRFWCGWLCPLGSLLGWLRWPAAKRTATRLPGRLRDVKYIVLGAIVGMAALGSLFLLVLDPIALLTRAVATTILPAFDAVATALQGALGQWGATEPIAAWMQTSLRGGLLPTSQPNFEQAWAIFLLLVGVVLLNLLADRFWCRYLCPLGALLALVSRVQVLRPLVGDGCTRCTACVKACGMGAIEVPARRPAQPGAAVALPSLRTAECTMCLDCLAACPASGAMTFGAAVPRPAQQPYDPGRRAFLTAAALSAGVVAGAGAAIVLGRSVPTAAAAPRLIRPPGAQDEAAFLSHCIRCGECLLVCPTNGLQPALLQGGLEALWTPVLMPRLGPCDYACAACGRVCPSSAIPALALDEKRLQVLGRAFIDERRCLPWAEGTPCSICEEMCPVPQKAIVLEEPQLITRADGTQDYLSRPRVVRDLCTGCGMCEHYCPVEGTAAIVVERHTGTGEGQGQGRGRGDGSGRGRGDGSGQGSGSGSGEGGGGN